MPTDSIFYKPEINNEEDCGKLVDAIEESQKQERNKTEANAEVVRGKKIKELFEDYDKNYSPKEIEWGEPIGEEIFQCEKKAVSFLDTAPYVFFRLFFDKLLPQRWLQ